MNCPRCHKQPVAADRSKCSDCLAYMTDYVTALRDIRRLKGQCIGCGGPEDGSARCEQCRAKRRKRITIPQPKTRTERREAVGREITAKERL